MHTRVQIADSYIQPVRNTVPWRHSCQRESIAEPYGTPKTSHNGTDQPEGHRAMPARAKTAIEQNRTSVSRIAGLRPVADRMPALSGKAPHTSSARGAASLV